MLSGVTPEEIASAYVNEQDWYSNGIAHYIECREGYDRLLDLESFGGKIRDTEDEFKGAEFRDDKTKLMFAYDYKNKLYDPRLGFDLQAGTRKRTEASWGKAL